MKTTVLSGVIRVYVPHEIIDRIGVEEFWDVKGALAKAAYGLTAYTASGYYAPDQQGADMDVESVQILEMWVNQQNEPQVEALVLSLVERLLEVGELEVLVVRNEVATLYRL